MNKYGEALKERRQVNNMSLIDLEKATGISNQNLSRWENGVIPRVDFCVQLAQYYGISVDELIGISDYNDTPKEKNLTLQPKNTLSTFDNEFKEILTDNNFIQTAKLFKSITPELRALTLGYIIGLLQSNNVNTQQILDY